MSTPPTRPSPARDQFIDVLRSRGMLRPGEEWVIDVNLRAYAHELAEQQRDHAEAEWPGDDTPSVLRRVVAGRVADLIDPEVQR
jgi:hypothetical protein